jgi:hypothetical protein
MFKFGDLLVVKKHNSLNVVRRDDLHMSLITLQLNIQKLVSFHQAQGTH